MNKRQLKLSKLAAAAPAAIARALSCSPNSVDRRSVAAAAEEMHDQEQRRPSGAQHFDTVRTLVETPFPHAEVLFRPAGDKGGTTASAGLPSEERDATTSRSALDAAMRSSRKGLETTPTSKQSYLARPYASPKMYAPVADSEWFRVLLESGGGSCPPLFPLLCSASGDDGIALSADAVVFLGGYAPTDLATMVAEKLSSVIPLQSDLASYDKASVRTRQLLNTNKLQAYLRRGAVEKSLKEKGCFLHHDVLELAVPVYDDGAMDEKTAAATRRSLYLTVGDPEWFPSQLNLIDRDENRILFRPSFGYSEYLLLQRLPPAITGGARLLLRNGHELLSGGDLPDGISQAPSLPFWLSCAAHMLASRMDVQCGTAEEVAAATQTWLCEDYSNAVEAIEWNYFLPVERFSMLSWWRAVQRVNSPFSRPLRSRTVVVVNSCRPRRAILLKDD